MSLKFTMLFKTTELYSTPTVSYSSSVGSISIGSGNPVGIYIESILFILEFSSSSSLRLAVYSTTFLVKNISILL